MKQIDGISRPDLLELSILDRVAFVYCIRKWFENELNDYLSVYDFNNLTIDKLDSILIHLATGEIQPTLPLANQVWKLVFDLSIEAEVASKGSKRDEYNRLIISCECAKFLYNTILAIQSQSLPSSIYIARSLDALENVLKSIEQYDFDKKIEFQQRIRSIYQKIHHRDKTVKTNLLIPISTDFLKSKFNFSEADTNKRSNLHCKSL